MPMYEVHHVTALKPQQQQRLAESITHIHTRQFTTPSLLVNVLFRDGNATPHFVAGKQRSVNMIAATVRPDGRSREAFDELCAKVEAAWKEIVQPKSEAEELRRISVFGSKIGGWEAGFAAPKAGEDKAWLAKNMDAFKARAEAGDDDFVEMLREMREREDLKAAGA